MAPGNEKQEFDVRLCDLRRQACHQRITDMEKRLVQAIEQANKVSDMADKGHKQSLQNAIDVIQKTFEQGSDHFKELERQIEELKISISKNSEYHDSIENDIKELSDNFTSFRLSWMKEIEEVKEKLENDIKDVGNDLKNVDDKVKKWRNIGIGIALTITTIFAIIKVVAIIIDKF